MTMMRSIFLAAALYAAGFADAFQQSAPCTVRVAAAAQSASGSATALHEYVPSGFTKASWAKFKAEEAKKKEAARNLGGLGPRGFKSRSMQSFQEALERGEAEHLMPMFNAKEKLAKGQIRKEDIPYMQRGGSWDNSDVSGAKKKKWLNSDKEYAGGGYKRFQSVSILGEGGGLDWTGKRDKTGPSGAGVKLGKNYKAPNVANIKGAAEKQPKKKMFGFF